MKNSLILYIVLFFSHHLCAQKSVYTQEEAHLYYRNFTVRDGLPSNEAYFVYQDKAGYIWICTDNGVSRFDGIQFQNYNEEEGLCSNVVFGCKEDPKGDLWVYSYSGELYRYLPASDRFECPGFNDSLARILRGKVILDLVFERDTIYVVASGSYVKLCFLPNKQVRMDLVEASPQTLNAKVLSNREVVVVNTMGGSITRFDFVLTHANTNVTDTIKNIPIYGLVDQQTSALIEKDLFIVFGENLFTYDFGRKEHRIELLPFSHTPVLKKSGGGILSGSFGKGLWSIKKEENHFIYKQLLKDKNISGSLEDRQGDIWACSQTDGVYFIPSSAALSFSRNEDDASRRIASLFTFKDSAFYMTYSGALYMLSTKGSPVQEMLIPPGLYNMRNMKVLNNREILLMGKRILSYNIFTRQISDISNDEICRRGTLLHETSFSVNHDRLIMKNCNGSSTTEKILSEEWKFGRIISKAVGNKGEIWLGTIRDLIFIDPTSNKISEVGKKDGFQKLFAKYILSLGGDSVIVASSHGIFFIVRDKIKKHITHDDGLSSNKVHSLFLSDGVLLAGTSKGIDKILNFCSSGNALISSITGLTGMHECPALHFGHAGNYLVAGTDEGVYLFDRTLLFQKATPIFAKIKGLTINDSTKISSLADPLSLRYNQNSILVRFTALNYRNSLFNKYRYRLKTKDQTHWSFTSQNHVLFPLLSPGTYEFELQAMNPDGSWSVYTAGFSLTIEKPFWQTWWFIFLSFVGAAIGTYFVFRLRIRQLRYVSDLTNKLSEAKMQALGMQLNPHFVFNALNSVSFHMARNDIKATLKILGKFAKLMRFIFRNSRYAIISLEDELKALNLYIELETVRLGTDFTYSIDIENINTYECKIPALLLQPFVENAIWHGIGPMNGGGKIDVVFMHIGDTLQIEIIDNGIGRENAALIKPQTPKRLHSLDIIKERLALLQTKYKSDVYMELDDAYENSEFCGTRVLLIIPWLTDPELADRELADPEMV